MVEVNLVLRRDSNEAVAVSASAGRSESPATQTNRLLTAYFHIATTTVSIQDPIDNVDRCALESSLCHLVGERFIWSYLFWFLINI